MEGTVVHVQAEPKLQSKLIAVLVSSFEVTPEPDCLVKNGYIVQMLCYLLIEIRHSETVRGLLGNTGRILNAMLMIIMLVMKSSHQGPSLIHGGVRDLDGCFCYQL